MDIKSSLNTPVLVVNTAVIEISVLKDIVYKQYC